MSKTVYVEFRNQGFWVYDVVSSVFLKHLIEVATPRLSQPEEDWLSAAIGHWRVNAVMSDFGLFLDDEWSAEQVQIVTELATVTCNLLTQRISISVEELHSVPIVDGLPVDTRDMPSVPTSPVIRFGEALIQLLNGSLPEPPPGTWWFFEMGEDVRTIRKKEL